MLPSPSLTDLISKCKIDSNADSYSTSVICHSVSKGMSVGSSSEYEYEEEKVLASCV